MTVGLRPVGKCTLSQGGTSELPGLNRQGAQGRKKPMNTARAEDRPAVHSITIVKNIINKLH